MIHITDLLSESNATSPYVVDGKERWLPVAPMPLFTLRTRLSDAWAVFCYRATAVDFSRRLQDIPTPVCSQDDAPDGYQVGRAVCRLCNKRAVSVHPIGTDSDALECPRCHHMTMEVV